MRPFIQMYILAGMRDPCVVYMLVTDTCFSYRCNTKAAEDIRFGSMLNACQRHRHKPSYCGWSATKACRFGYPFDLQTRTCFTWTLDKGTLKPGRNDRFHVLFLSQYIITILQVDECIPCAWRSILERQHRLEINIQY